MPRFILLFVCFFSLSSVSAQTAEIDSLLNELDQTIDSTEHYDQIKEKSLVNLKDLLHIDLAAESQFDIYGKLFDAYIDYNADSASTYAGKQFEIARRLDSGEKTGLAKLNLGISLTYTGIFREAEETLRSIPIEEYSNLRPKYYKALRRLYGDWFTYSTRSNDKEIFESGVDLNRQKLIDCTDVNSFEHILAYTDELNRYGKFEESLRISANYFNTIKPNSHERGSMAFNIALSYQGLKDSTNHVKWMIISSINDLKSSTKIYVFVRELAFEQFKKGNISRAYKYVRRSLEDALFSNARLQTLKTLEMLPIIDKSYQEQDKTSKRLLTILLFSISIFTILLLITTGLVYKQYKKLSAARSDLSQANSQLNELNHELYLINIDQKRANKDLSEANLIKEEYIGRFMDQCSSYIDKMEQYRHQLEQLALAGRMDDIVRKIKSRDFIDSELKEFYSIFDATFLNLFPTFIDEFNQLLTSPEVNKNDNSLTTELRIFALIRLGISDNVKISNFLRYSLSTIYNYKTKIRHKAVGDKDDLENKVMQIGQN